VVLTGFPTLTLFNVTTNDAGNYTVIITNPYGSVTSAPPATLTVPIPPTVSITEPADNTTIIVSQTNVTLTATAMDSDATIVQVQFFEGATSLGIVTNPSYSLVWSNATDGSYALTAVATDSYGLSATSSVVNIFIIPLTQPLVVYAGPNQVITNGNSAVQITSTELQGVVSGPGGSAPNGSFVATWSVVNSPTNSTVTFADVNLTNSIVTFNNSQATLEYIN